jgi:hypothetical protein
MRNSYKILMGNSGGNGPLRELDDGKDVVELVRDCVI